MHRLVIVLSAFVLFGVSMVAAENPAGTEHRVRVQVPATTGTNGSYTVCTPGEPTITVRSDGSGGYTIQRIGEAPISVKPAWGGQGFTIDPPHGPSSTVTPLWGSEMSTALPVPVPITIGE
jgi:hypothetical protein